MQEDVIKRLIGSLKCGCCGESYRDAGIDVIEHKEDVWFLKVRCPACHFRSLVAAIIREDTAAPDATDLTLVERAKFDGAGAIGEDYLLEMHDFLQDFHGDLDLLLR